MMFVLTLGHFGPPLSRVMTHVRRGGLVSREELARRTGLSASSVARAVSLLVDGGLLRERPDLLAAGAVGRPSVPVEVDGDAFVTLGCHVGRRTITVSLGDLRGRVLAHATLPAPPPSEPDADAVLARQVARRLTGLLAEHPARVAVSAGLVAPWGDIHYDRGGLAAALEETLVLDVESWEMIPAIAAADYLARPDDLPGSTLYLYARDTVGFVMANRLPTGVEVSRVGRLGHFPMGGGAVCRCGRTGCLEALVSDESVAAAAHAAGVTPVPDVHALHRRALQGDRRAHRLLWSRAEALGRVTALVRDMVHPDRIVLSGQAFTAYPPALEAGRASFQRHTATPGPVEFSFTRFTDDVQAVAAGTVALRRVYDDPAAVLAACAGDRCASG